jgi:hypothetical protein
VISGVEYPNPNFSHFASQSIWQTAQLSGDSGPGWLGRWLDITGTDPFRALSVGPNLPTALVGSRQQASSVADFASPSAQLPDQNPPATPFQTPRGAVLGSLRLGPAGRLGWPSETRSRLCLACWWRVDDTWRPGADVHDGDVRARVQRAGVRLGVRPRVRAVEYVRVPERRVALWRS